ncbi:hypothetical protein [uncultured Methanoregula sp.]|uniref:hypothetical protein n=1 Tax=uncultured Methanoregula sp. TaxID=1005933 RepID=UPI002AAB6BD5|nr:hypothetical protein [uncultured Methanoregula sp.]
MRSLAIIGAIVLSLFLVMGSVSQDTSDDYAKIFMIVLCVHPGGAVVESADIQYGHAPNLGHQEGNFTTIVRAANGTALFTFEVWDPRTQFGEYSYKMLLEEHEMTEGEHADQYAQYGQKKDIDLPLFIPYHRDIQTVDVIDKSTGDLLISVNLSPAKEAFRQKFPKDPDMISEIQQNSPGIHMPVEGQGVFLLAGGLLALVLIGLLIHLVRRA